jgi:hypothetical protein
MLEKFDDLAEIENNDGWTTISIVEALCQPRSRRLRCLGCGGQLRAHKEGTTGQRAHFEHYERHDGCPRVNYFGDKPRPHPRSLS